MSIIFHNKWKIWFKTSLHSCFTGLLMTHHIKLCTFCPLLPHTYFDHFNLCPRALTPFKLLFFIMNFFYPLPVLCSRRLNENLSSLTSGILFFFTLLSLFPVHVCQTGWGPAPNRRRRWSSESPGGLNPVCNDDTVSRKWAISTHCTTSLKLNKKNILLSPNGSTKQQSSLAETGFFFMHKLRQKGWLWWNWGHKVWKQTNKKKTLLKLKKGN